MASMDLTPPDSSDSPHTQQYGPPQVSGGTPPPAPQQAAPPPAPAPSAQRPAPAQPPVDPPVAGELTEGYQPALFDPAPANPGSEGEHQLQQACGTTTRAERFYNDQMLDHLNEEMQEFVGRMDMAFVATADANGEADCSLRAGPPGFLLVLNDKCVAYPEYRGNGVMASLGNIIENPHVGIMLIDFVRDQIGLHINGRARIVEDDKMREEFTGIPEETVRGRIPERWVVVEIAEAYIHCRKHIPRLKPAERHRAWGTDDSKRKGGDYFGVRQQRREAAAQCGEPGQLRVNGS
ncbi:pyridoxamine 5'-phosphate oxidase family protein [Haloechinothrix aidingensis]